MHIGGTGLSVATFTCCAIRIISLQDYRRLKRSFSKRAAECRGVGNRGELEFGHWKVSRKTREAKRELKEFWKGGEGICSRFPRIPARPAGTGQSCGVQPIVLFVERRGCSSLHLTRIQYVIENFHVKSVGIKDAFCRE